MKYTISFIDEINNVPEEVVQRLVDGESISICVKSLQGYEEYSNMEKDRLEDLITAAFNCVVNEKVIKYYEENNFKITKYQIITSGNELVCKKCKKLSEKKFKFEERIIGENFPPLHLGCKCTAIFE